MGIEVVFLILAVLVVAFGIGVIVVNRRRTGGWHHPQLPAPTFSETTRLEPPGCMVTP